MKDPLGDRILAVLAEGGPRKPAILQALALHLGYTRHTFQRSITRLKAARRIKVYRRAGGPHYGLP